MDRARVQPAEPHRVAPALALARADLSSLEAASEIRSGAVLELLVTEPLRPAPDGPALAPVRTLASPGPAPSQPAEDLMLPDPGADYQLLKDRMVAGILAAATPQDPERLFPGPGGPDAVTFGRGAAGVLYALADVGAQVPEPLVDWFSAAAERLDAGPGLFDGLSGVALTLDKLGRSAQAARIWDRVAQAPLADLDVSVTRGLAGLGLALLERSPIPDETCLMARLAELAAELVDRLEDEPSGAGVLDGGTGAALFLLGLVDLTEDETLLPAVERALRQDLDRLGWGPPGTLETGTSENAGQWWDRPVLGPGSAGLAMVLREAREHLSAPWLAEALDWITLACEVQVPEAPGLFDGRAGTAVALWYLRRTPWDTPERRRTILHPHLERLGLPTGADSASTASLDDGGTAPVDLVSGTAGILLALETLLGAEDRRIPFFW
ncbi:lanthionine synthetase C family protein [Georgenia sp. TF02-10]|uniref:lanthionine synthetase C family protein n=1 Tax=Georgenia sp. TF02-10 TaxID=2917725 RepID=UPI001FA757FC|nr:lanthionine synthetase C family protein [Georgenia sp. TF02-10]UNX54706.1 lanthionine synthetase C family protein [Georgenia sp. TF02-10]